MDLFEFKQLVENNRVNSDAYIFQSDDSFVAAQYIRKIAQDKSYEIEYISSLDVFSSFFGVDEHTIYVYKIDKFIAEDISQYKNLYIICKSIENKDLVNKDHLLVIPKLSELNIKNYAAGMLEGINEKDISWLCDICNNNIYKVDSEVSKLSIFKPEHRQRMFDELKKDNSLNYLSQYNIFSLTDAIISREIANIGSILKERALIDINEIGFTKTLINNFLNVINIQMQPNATAASLSISEGQFKAIKYYRTRKYSDDKLINILTVLSNVDKQIKSGYLPVEIAIDYLILKILN